MGVSVGPFALSRAHRCPVMFPTFPFCFIVGPFRACTSWVFGSFLPGLFLMLPGGWLYPRPCVFVSASLVRGFFIRLRLRDTPGSLRLLECAGCVYDSYFTVLESVIYVIFEALSVN